eukprot:CAMPEP_0118963484 /NCGR_PEP_ID=MMETSP1173-20130426/1360_1 /TAXON_ID=1034831 /ORGANISM="Rhizochromulina marina cf, Strain CCMP1243" /LENGTH=253 /DNA_ID=CAMNT_0006911817 /DNA_START=8 /DNA_END=769 /DNA_ORIENTATION=-
MRATLGRNCLEERETAGLVSTIRSFRFIACCTLLAATTRSSLAVMGLGSSKPPPAEAGSQVTADAPGPTMRATLGAGCYWGTEKFVKKDWGGRTGAVVRTAVGFMGPANAKANPSYREVCTGTTGHVEVLDLEFKATQGKGEDELYEDLVRFFFQFHDPTTANRQGNDVGTQYSSVIFTHSERQKEIANKVKGELQQLVDGGKIQRYQGKSVVTAVVDASTFYPAHKEHQDYLAKNPSGYCNHFMRFKKWPEP